MKTEHKIIIAGGVGISIAGLIAHAIDRFNHETEAEQMRLNEAEKSRHIPETIDAEYEIIEEKKLPTIQSLLKSNEA